jgi:hypothetical protein
MRGPNMASAVPAVTAYRSAADETFLTRFVSHIHRKKPKGRAIPKMTRPAKNAKSKIRFSKNSLSKRSGAQELSRRI